MALVAAGPLTLELVASRTGAGTPGADALLAIGLRAESTPRPGTRASSSTCSPSTCRRGHGASIALVGGVHVIASGSPLGQSELASVTGATLTVGADAMSIGLDWRAGPRSPGTPS